MLALFGRPRGYLAVVLFAVLAILPLALPPNVLHLLILTYIIGVGAIGWNVIGGFGGQFSLGNGVFVGLTGYTMGILMVTYGVSYPIALVAGLGVTLVAAVVIGFPTFRLTGHYFALATITIVEGMRFLARYARWFTGGERGFSIVPATLTGEPALNLTRTEYYLIALALFAGAIVLSTWIRYSKLGYYLMALRDDQLAASSVGINVPRFKMYGWLVSALLTGSSGAMYATYVQYLDPEFMFSITLSVTFAVIPIIGGIGTIVGPAVGAAIFVPLEHIAITEFGGQYGAITYVVYGIVLILMIIYAPEGFVPRVRFLWDRVERVAPTFGPGAPAREPDPDR